MKKHLLYTALWLMGLMWTLAIWVVSTGNYVTTLPQLVVTWEQDGQIFEYWVLKFNDGSGHIIMLLDRNLWATMTWAWADANTGSYWFKYQWGNNYWFADGCWTEWCSDSVTENATWTLAIWDPNYDNSNYSWDTFIRSDLNHWVDYWSSWNHTNLRWGWTDSQNNNWWLETMTMENIVNRQGPCPKWYHVPSIWERNNLAIYWHNANAWLNMTEWILYDFVEIWYTETFKEAFFLPIVNYRSTNSVLMSAASYLWSSSPINTFSYCLFIPNWKLDPRCNIPRGLWLPIRCFYDAYLFPYKYSFIDGNIKLKSWSVISGEKLVDIINLSELNTTKEWYNFNYWYIQWAEDTEFDFTGTIITGNIEFYAKRKPIEYTITYELDGWINSENNVTWYTIEDTITFENPTKDWYTFDGWFLDTWFTTQITEITQWSTWNIILYAKWTKIETKTSWGSSGWGGRSNKTSSDSEKTTEWQAWSQQPLSPQQASDSSPNREQTVTPLIGGDGEARGGWTQTYTQEFQQAYKFAHEKWITTMPTIQEAQMDWKLTRIAMAKMLSQYAMNVLRQKPANIVTPKFNDVSNKQNSDYDDWVTLAYQLWIMWQNMPNNKFRPNDEVTRAEFATALSRMIYNTSDGEYKSTPKYYIHHMEKLVKEWIITKDDPNMKELRGYVMIMLMRSAK